MILTFAGWLFAGCLSGTSASIPTVERITVCFDTPAAFEEAFRDQFITVDSDHPEFRLARSFLVTNEAGRTAKFFDTLADADLAKVVMEIPSADVRGAVLLLYYSYQHEGKHPAFIEVNGNRRAYVHDEARMLTGGWARHDIPVGDLRNGLNDVVIGGAGGLHVDTYSRAGRSARSFDGGRTWKPNALGTDGDWQGEYMVRLRLYGYPPAGEVTSEVLDAAAVGKDPVLRPVVRLRNVMLQARTTLPAGTSIAWAIRSGSTPTVMGRTWTEWQEAAIGKPVEVPGNRYVQWRATLRTVSPKSTPSVKSVTVAMEAEVERREMAGVSVSVYENPKIVRSSYPFVHETDTPRIRHLREKYDLPGVIRPGRTESEQQAILRKWVSHQWKDGWDEGKYRYVPPWDALELLEFAKGNLSLGMCTHYSCTYVQTGAALGFNTRSVILDHHCVAEVWSNELGKWVVQDAGPGPGPNGYPVGFAYRREGHLLSALELHRALAEQKAVEAVPHNDLKPPWTADAEWMQLFTRFGIPLRNNHLSEPEPAEVEHGRQQYHWDGYLWWTDSVDEPKYEEYRLLSNRVGDFTWTLNQAVMDLQVRDRKTITVNLDTYMPNFKTFEAKVEDGEWAEVSTGFAWPLHEGMNVLRVRAVNQFGLCGPVSRVVLNRIQADVLR